MDSESTNGKLFCVNQQHASIHQLTQHYTDKHNSNVASLGLEQQHEELCFNTLRDKWVSARVSARPVPKIKFLGIVVAVYFYMPDALPVTEPTASMHRRMTVFLTWRQQAATMPSRWARKHRCDKIYQMKYVWMTAFWKHAAWLLIASSVTRQWKSIKLHRERDLVG